jgi:hypothetical protein
VNYRFLYVWCCKHALNRNVGGIFSKHIFAKTFSSSPFIMFKKRSQCWRSNSIFIVIFRLVRIKFQKFSMKSPSLFYANLKFHIFYRSMSLAEVNNVFAGKQRHEFRILWHSFGRRNARSNQIEKWASLWNLESILSNLAAKDDNCWMLKWFGGWMWLFDSREWNIQDKRRKQTQDRLPDSLTRWLLSVLE